MSVKTFIFGQAVDHQTSLSGIPKEYVCDTWAERPTSGLIGGSRCFVLEDGKIYRATNATTWVEIGGSQGGSDPWTYLRLTVDFTTTSSTAVDITGLGFTPIANTRYEFVGRLMVRTATATVGPRPGVAWATGLTDGVAFVQQTSSATANVFANGNITATVLAPVGGVPTTTGSWPALIEGMAVAGAGPSGNIRLVLASETNGTTVRAVAGSFLKYRTVP